MFYAHTQWSDQSPLSQFWCWACPFPSVSVSNETLSFQLFLHVRCSRTAGREAGLWKLSNVALMSGHSCLKEGMPPSRDFPDEVIVFRQDVPSITRLRVHVLSVARDLSGLLQKLWWRNSQIHSKRILSYSIFFNSSIKTTMKTNKGPSGWDDNSLKKRRRQKAWENWHFSFHVSCI